ncbi:MAG: hypothetical protein AAFR98_11850 [Pseudomonadota bacterium]
MDGLSFFEVMGAVLAANLLTVMFVYSMYILNKREADAPWGFFAGAAVPLLFVFFIVLPIGGQ